MRWWIVLLALQGMLAGSARAGDSPVVVELFTSQGCSSCPPADAFLTDLARQRQDVLALAFHVTYWNYPGWRDPFSLDAATARQRDYARLLGEDEIYTPEMVVDGASAFVGSNRDDGLRAIERAVAKSVPVSIRADGGQLTITVGSGTGQGRILLIGYDRSHRTPVRGGENSGQTLVESNIVRTLTPLGSWVGTAVSLTAPSPAGERFAALIQSPNGRIIGAARLTPGP